MNISGVLVHAMPENVEQVTQQLEQVSGVEVHGVNETGRMVVTVEATSDQTMADTVLGLQNMDGVLAVSMVYHQFDDNDFQEQTIMSKQEMLA